MPDAFYTHVSDTLATLRDEGLYKPERVMTTPQDPRVRGTPPPPPPSPLSLLDSKLKFSLMVVSNPQFCSCFE